MNLILMLLLTRSGYADGRDLFYETYFTASPENRTDSMLVLLSGDQLVHPYWRGAAWRVCSGDSASGDSLLGLWLEELPGDPRAWLSASESALDSFPERAINTATMGLSVFTEWHPEGMPDEEWELVGPALEHNLRFLRCRGFFARGDRITALEELSPLLEPGLFTVDDYHTRAPYLFLAGEIHLEAGDTLRAVEFFIGAAVEGDIENKWAGRADSLLHELLGVHYMERCRAISGYSGPVFNDASHLLPGTVYGTRHAWGDINGNGRPDLLAGGTILLNTPGGFLLYDSLPVNGGVIADLNRDGLPDILGLGRQPLIFLQTREGRFREATAEMGLDSVEAQVEGAVVLDWNRNGWLDVYLAVYEDPDSIGVGRSDAFYFGGPEGFASCSDFNLDPPLCGRGVSVVSLEDDGSPSILVSNYRLDPNVFWENIDGKPENTASERGLAGFERENAWGHTISSAWADFDQDGEIDVFSANLAHPRYITFSDRSMLLRNNGGVFTDVRAEMGIRYEETHSFPAWADFTGNGFPDLYITSVYPRRRSFLYLNTGEGFVDATWLAGARVFNGWQVSTEDANLDGLPDIIVNEGGVLRLLLQCEEHQHDTPGSTGR